MSSRERWTIYPLLFLALGASLRSKLTHSIDVASLSSERVEGASVKASLITAPTIKCTELVAGRIVVAGAGPDTGRIEIYGQDGRLVAQLAAEPETNAAVLRLQTADGRPQVVLHTGPGGGAVTTIGADGLSLVELGPGAGETGVVVHDLHAKPAPGSRPE